MRMFPNRWHKARVAIRADASVALGSGHVMRCAALAAALRERGADIVFVCRSGPGDLCDFLSGAGFPVHRLEAAVDDAAATLAALGEGMVDWLVVDHYRLDARWERQLRAASRNILAIDDLADRSHACDILLDQNYFPDAESRYAGLLPQQSVRLLGPDYALLRSEFAHPRAQRRDHQGKVLRLLCCFGGSDADNVTGMALKALALLALPGIAVDVVVGASNPWRQAVAQQCADMRQVAFHCQADNMAELMLAADLCIGAGGSSSLERCCVGLPSLVLSTAANQIEVARALAGLGCLRYLGSAAEMTPARLAQALSEMLDDEAGLRTMSERGAQLVDGTGAARVADRMVGYTPDIALRRATLDDEQALLEWRNAPQVRAASFDARVIGVDEHQRWLRALLADPARHLLVAEQCGRPVAVLRYDVSGQEAEVSVFLLPGLAGRGLGSAVLQQGNRWLCSHLPQLQRVRARILPGNSASRGAFEKAGYAASGPDYICALDRGIESPTRNP